MGLFIAVSVIVILAVIGMILYMIGILLPIFLNITLYGIVLSLLVMGWFFIGVMMLVAFGFYEIAINISGEPLPVLSLFAGAVVACIVQITILKLWIIPNIQKVISFIKIKFMKGN